MASIFYDPADAVVMLGRSDAKLAALIERVGPCRLLEARDYASPFHALLRAIVYQQLSGKAAGTIYQRVAGLFSGQQPLTPANLLLIEDEALRAAGLSRAKTLAVKDLAVKTIEGIVPELDELQQLEDDEIIRRLIQVRGIGRWTVEMMLMTHLGRPDVFPVDDLGVRKGFMLLYELEKIPAAKELYPLGEPWRPYRSVASWYLWRALDTPTLA
jgi:3-methyladenine DNA glycosylase/8-oxoguanine DNA glycosylase